MNDKFLSLLVPPNFNVAEDFEKLLPLLLSAGDDLRLIGDKAWEKAPIFLRSKRNTLLCGLRQQYSHML